MHTKEQLTTFFDDEFHLLLKNITPDCKPIWGTMDAQRMMEHVAIAFKIANGKIEIPASAIDAKSVKLKRLFLLSDKPLPRDFHNPILSQGLKSYEHQSFEIAKQKLIDEVESFHFYFNKKTDSTCVHNLFGNLNYHEWLWFEYKHVMHHFMQFRIVPLSDKII